MRTEETDPKAEMFTKRTAERLRPMPHISDSKSKKTLHSSARRDNGYLRPGLESNSEKPTKEVVCNVFLFYLMLGER
ncbi:Hypothetical protein NTJ_07173 [Nesidiocoris tenuis]|uniref:Uncharacterized protein n=1 Tax=Nesidiocoris tenuis TaxID=355587 RepID=A0ABN7ASV4_9HEMI|nr:Hypothetical protein NTJ_07173 [Nesidiocoris tenuis]